MKIVDFFDAIYDAKPDFVKENFSLLNDDNKASVYHYACSKGALDLVKWIIDNPNFHFDEKLHGCTKEEYGFQGACHAEGKPVREYLIKEKKLTLSDEMLYWMRENKLGKLIPGKQKIR